MWKADLETRNFSFEAYGATDEAARAALIVGLQKHAETYRIPSDWWEEYAEDIVYYEVRMGICYRHREPIT